MANLVLVTLSAFIAAFINAVAGGGTFITFPMLTAVAKLTEKAANVTSTIGLWPGTASSIAATAPEFRKLPRAMLVGYVIISLIGGAAGSILLIKTSTHAFKLVIPWLLAFATVIFSFSKPISRWAGRHHGNPSARWTVLVGFLQMAVAIYGGYFGAGIGVLMLAGLAFTGLQTIHQMNAMKVLLSSAINGISCIVFCTSPEVNWRLAGAMAIAAAIGGFVGMRFSRKIQPDYLRAAIIVVGATLSIAYFLKNY